LALVLGTIFKGYLDFRRAYGDPELVRAAAGGDATRVRQLLQHGSPTNSYHLEGSSALWWAVSSDSLECVQLLLDHGADPNGHGQWDSVIEKAVQDLEFNDDGKPRTAIIQALLAQRSRIRDPAQLKLLEDAATRKR
jgi:ankyrin repeat protein